MNWTYKAEMQKLLNWYDEANSPPQHTGPSVPLMSLQGCEPSAILLHSILHTSVCGHRSGRPQNQELNWRWRPVLEWGLKKTQGAAQRIIIFFVMTLFGNWKPSCHFHSTWKTRKTNFTSSSNLSSFLHLELLWPQNILSPDIWALNQ